MRSLGGFALQAFSCTVQEIIKSETSLVEMLLQEQTSQFFSNKLQLSEAPLSFVKSLFHSFDDVDDDDVIRRLAAASQRHSDAANASFMTEDSSTIFACQENLSEEDRFEQELFMDALTGDVLLEMSDLFQQWIASGSDEFWTLLNVVSKDPAPISGRRSSVRRLSTLSSTSGRRRMSVRLSVSGGSLDVPSKCLVAVLHQLVVRGCKAKNISVALLAAKCYMQMLQLPGVSAYYSVFNQMVVHDIVQLFRFLIIQDLSGAQTARASSKSDRGVSEKEDEDFLLQADEPMSGGDAPADSVMPDVSADELTEIVKTFAIVLEECAKFLRAFRLASHSELVLQLVGVSVELLQCEQVLSDTSKNVETIRRNALPMLSSLALPIHGKPQTLYRQIMKELLQVVSHSVNSQEKNRNTKSKIYSWIRASMRDFFYDLSDLCTSDEEYADFHMEVYILLQNFCINVPDKADERDECVTLIGDLYMLISEDLKFRFAKWCTILGNTAKVAHRSFGADICIVLASKIQDDSALRTLTSFVLTRCTDKAPVVRSRALLALSSIFPDDDAMAVEFEKCQQLIVSEMRGSFAKTLVERIHDDKSAVRKSAVQFVKRFISFASREGWAFDSLLRSILSHVSQRARDTLPTVRKLVLDCVSQVCRLYRNEDVVWKFWSKAVVFQLFDDDNSVSDAAFASWSEFMIKEYADEQPSFWAAWPQFTEVAGERLSTIYAVAMQKGMISDSIFKQSFDRCEQEPANNDYWQLLYLVTPEKLSKPVAAGFVEIKNLLEESQLFDCQRYYLRTLRKIAASLSAENKSVMTAYIEDIINTRNVHSSSIDIAVECLAKLKKPAELSEWAVNISKGLKKFSMYAGDSNVESKQKELIVMGCVASLFPQYGNDFERILNGIITSDTSAHVDTSLRSYAIVAIGKICMQNEGIAKQYIPILARELETSDEPDQLMYASLVLGNLCKRYSRLVEIFIPALANLFKHYDPSVRIQALGSLSQLLMEDYVKWKGNLFFKFVTSLADGNHAIVALTKHCLEQVSQRNPLLFGSSFIDVLIMMNGNKSCKFSNILLSQKEEELFCFPGEYNREKRETIYSYLLKRMPDDQKFNLTRRLCIEILQGVLVGKIDFNSAVGSWILRDTLNVLSGKDIKTKSKPSASNKGDDAEDTAQEKIAALQSKIHSQISRKLAIETIIPIVVQLKRLLEEKRSPLLRDIMVFLREIVKDFRVEFQDLMVSDRQLAHEIEFDLRNFEKQQKDQEIQQKQNNRRESLVNVGNAIVDQSFKAPFAKLKVLATPVKLIPDASNSRIVSENKENDDESSFYTPAKSVSFVAVTPRTGPAGMQWNIMSPAIKPASKRIAEESDEMFD